MKAKANEKNSGRLMTASELSSYETGGPSFRPYAGGVWMEPTRIAVSELIYFGVDEGTEESP